jgi:hypothetical protein
MIRAYRPSDTAAKTHTHTKLTHSCYLLHIFQVSDVTSEADIYNPSLFYPRVPIKIYIRLRTSSQCILFMSDLANLYPYEGCAAMLGITPFFELTFFNSPAPSPGLSIALVSVLPDIVRGSWMIALVQVVGNVISFCLYGALTVQLCASHPTRLDKFCLTVLDRYLSHLLSQ